MAQGLKVREVATRLKVGKTALYEALSSNPDSLPTPEEKA